MKKQNRYVSFIAMLLLPAAMLCFLTGCSKEDDLDLGIGSDDFEGLYEIISITSGQALDLNNDGIASNDLYSEYSSEFHWDNAVYFPEPFDFTDPYNFADFKRNDTYKVNHADFHFPYQDFNEGDWVGPEIPPLRCYNWGLGNMYYELTDNDQVEIVRPKNNNTKPINDMGFISSIKRLTKDVFQAEMTLEIYDFKQQKWVITPIWAVYERRSYYIHPEEE